MRFGMGYGLWTGGGRYGPDARHAHRGGRGPGGGRRRLFDGEQLQLLLLKLIADGPRHGYDLIREIEARSGGVYAPSPGVVYPTLTLIADMGFAAEQPESGGRKLYAITAEGAAHLETEAKAVDIVVERLGALAEMGNRTNGAPIRRSMENLRMALSERLQREGVGEEVMLNVAAIVDEAAQKIERLK